MGGHLNSEDIRLNPFAFTPMRDLGQLIFDEGEGVDVACLGTHLKSFCRCMPRCHSVSSHTEGISTRSLGEASVVCICTVWTFAVESSTLCVFNLLGFDAHGWAQVIVFLKSSIIRGSEGG